MVNHEIVVISYFGELELCKLQLKSFEAHVESTTINIIVNEPDVQRFINGVKPVVDRMVNHKVVFWPATDIATFPPIEQTRYLPRNDPFMSWDSAVECIDTLHAGYGWVLQQALKLLFALKHNKDYVVCDTKDIFMYPCSAYELDTKQYDDFGTGWEKKSLWTHPFQKDYYEDVAKRFGGDVDRDTINDYLTPQVIRHEAVYKIIEHFGSKEKFIEWFMSYKFMSEFIIHDYCVKILGLPEKRRQPSNFITYGPKVPSDHKVIKFHRSIYERPGTRHHWDNIENYINGCLKW